MKIKYQSTIIYQIRVLKCGHTYCKKCLLLLCENNTIICPRCRIQTDFPKRFTIERSIKVLAINHDILELVYDLTLQVAREETKREDIFEYYEINNIKRTNL